MSASAESVGMTYLAGVNRGYGLVRLQRQPADVLIACDDQVGHDENERGGQLLTAGQGRGDRPKPVSCRRWIAGYSVQDGHGHTDLTEPRAEREAGAWARLRRKGRVKKTGSASRCCYFPHTSDELMKRGGDTERTLQGHSHHSK